MGRLSRPYVEPVSRKKNFDDFKNILKKQKRSPEQFWDVSPAISCDPHIIFAFGLRSNGKTTGALEQGIKDYLNGEGRMAIIRRYDADFKSGGALDMFGSAYIKYVISTLTQGAWDSVVYRQNRWYFAKYDVASDKMVKETEPFAFAFSINESVRTKSRAYPFIKNIVFDECMTNDGYLNNEVSRFLNVVSTIVRQNGGTRIWLLGNTVDKNSIYFSAMGITNLKKLKPGDFYLYEVESETKQKTRVVLQYTDGVIPDKPNDSNVYFTAFSDPRISMITTGSWETGEYPKYPDRFIGIKPDVLFTYYIEYEYETLQADVLRIKDFVFTFIHPFSGKLKKRDEKVIFSSREYDPNPLHMRYINKKCSTNKIQEKIAEFFVNNQVYFSDNQTGETVHSYIEWCRKDKLV